MEEITSSIYNLQLKRAIQLALNQTMGLINLQLNVTDAQETKLVHDISKVSYFRVGF